MAEIAYLFHKDYLTDPSGQKYYASPYLVRVQDTDIQDRIAALAAGWVTNITALTDVPGQLSDLAALISTANLAYTTKAIMDADTGQGDDTLALVFNDSTSSNNGLYVSASGVWSATTLQLASASDLAAKADAARTVSAAGLATGGGDLSANRTITVTEASEVEAQAGTASTVAMTPRRAADFHAERSPHLDIMQAAGFAGAAVYSDFAAGVHVVNGDQVPLSQAVTYSGASVSSALNGFGQLKSEASGYALAAALEGLHLGPARTRLSTYPTTFSDASWTKSNCAVTDSSIVSPFGGFVSVVTASTTATTGFYQSVTADATAAASGVCFVIIAAKGSGASEAGGFQIQNLTQATQLTQITIDWDTGEVTTSIAGTDTVMMPQPGMPGFWRIEVRAAASGISEGDTLRFFAGFRFLSYSSGEAFKLAYAGVETNLQSGPVIVGTDASSQTVAKRSGAVDFTVEDELTHVIEFITPGAAPASTGYIAYFDKSSGTQTAEQIRLTVGANFALALVVTASSATQVNFALGTLQPLRRYRVAYSLKANQARCIVSDGAMFSDDAVTMPTGLDELDLGAKNAGASAGVQVPVTLVASHLFRDAKSESWLKDAVRLKEPFLLIHAGQSQVHAEGTVDQLPLDEDFQKIENVWIYNREDAELTEYKVNETSGYGMVTTTLTAAQKAAWGMDAAFARAFNLRYPGRPLIVMKQSAYNTDVQNDAGAGDWDPANSSELWDRFTDDVAKCRRLARKMFGGYNHAALNVVTFGEKASDNATGATNHGTNLNDFFTAWRNELSGELLVVERLRLFESDLATYTYSRQFTVRAGQESAAATDGNAVVVNLDGIPDAAQYLSLIHPGPEWVDGRGRRVFAAKERDYLRMYGDTTNQDPTNLTSFVDQTGVATSTLIYSNSLDIAGLGRGSPITNVTGGEYRVLNPDGTEWTTWSAGNGTIHPGQTLELRLTSSGFSATQTDMDFDVGSVSHTWSVTTA